MLVDRIVASFEDELLKFASQDELVDEQELRMAKKRDHDEQKSRDPRNIDPLGKKRARKGQDSFGEDREANRKKRQEELDAEDDGWDGSSTDDGVY